MLNLINDSEEKFRRNVIAHSSLLVGLLIVISIYPRHLISPLKTFVLIVATLVGFSLISVYFLIKKTNLSTNFCGNIFITVIAILGVNAGLGNGGIHAPVTIAFIILPIIGYFTIGKKGAILSLAYAFLGIIFLLYAEKTGLVVPFDTLQLSHYKAFIYAITTLISFVIGYSYEKSRMISAQTIHTQEENLDNILGAIPACVKIVKPDCTIDSMNEIGLNIIGTTNKDNVIGHNVCEFIAADAREQYSEMNKRICSGGKNETMQFKFITLDGHIKWLETHTAPYLKKNQTYHIAITHDITDRKITESYQNIHNEMLSSIVAKKPLSDTLKIIVDGLEKIIPHAKCSILFIDENQCLRSGSAPSLPAFFNEAVNGIPIGPGIGSCGTAAYTGQRVIVEDIETHPYWQQYRDLAKKANLASCWSEPILGDKNNILGTFALYTDKKHSPSELEITIVHNAAQLASIAIQYDQTEKKMQEQQNIVQTNSKMAALGEMASNVAHEINNPLAIIMGRIHVLEKIIKTDNIDKNQIENELHKIKSTTERIGKVTKGMMSFSRNAEHDPVYNTNLRKIIDETLQFCSARMKNESIELKLSEENFDIEFPCRQVQIEQVFLNLFNNAIDAMSGLQDKWIQVVCKKENSFLKIYITDAGNGIPANIIDKIMLPFFTTKDVGKGTGLGLSISKGIIESHNGRFQYNKKSANTQFIIELPLKG